MLAIKWQQSLNLEVHKLLHLNSIGLLNSLSLIGYVGAQIPTPKDKFDWRTLQRILEVVQKKTKEKFMNLQQAMEIIISSLGQIIQNQGMNTGKKKGSELRQFIKILGQKISYPLPSPPTMRKNKLIENRGEGDHKFQSQSQKFLESGKKKIEEKIPDQQTSNLRKKQFNRKASLAIKDFVKSRLPSPCNESDMKRSDTHAKFNFRKRMNTQDEEALSDKQLDSEVDSSLEQKPIKQTNELLKRLEKYKQMKKKQRKKKYVNNFFGQQKKEESQLFFYQEKQQEKKQERKDELILEEKPEKIIEVKCEKKKICSICYEQIPILTICPLSCGHELHKTCLNQHFKHRVLDKKFPIYCPECPYQINIQQIQNFIQPETQEKYSEFKFQNYVKQDKQTHFCPTPGCSTVFQAPNNIKQFSCPSCKKVSCINCENEFHKGMSCQQFQNQNQKFLQTVTKQNYKQCPNCKLWIQRLRGCDHMTCRCKFQFCYKCGQAYKNCPCKKS